MQGLLELLDVAYVGSGVLASAACMDKVVFKDLMAHAGLPQVAYVGVDDARWREDRDGVAAEVAALGLPVFVKPARLGSSVGIVRVAEAGELAAALDQAFGHDPRVIVEAAAPGLEIECSVRGPHDGRRGERAGRDRRAAQRVAGRLVRLRGEVHARRHGARRARADRAAARGTASASWRCARSARRAAAAWPAPTSSSTARRCCSTS